MAEIPPLVVDANVIVSGVLKDGVTRRLLRDPRLRLYAPQFLWMEIDSATALIQERSGLLHQAIDALLARFKEHILTVPAPLVQRHLGEATEGLKGGDLDDAPYLAAALVIGGAIWTHDRSFRERAGLPTIGTADLIQILA